MPRKTKASVSGIWLCMFASFSMVLGMRNQLLDLGISLHQRSAVVKTFTFSFLKEP